MTRPCSNDPYVFMMAEKLLYFLMISIATGYVIFGMHSNESKICEMRKNYQFFYWEIFSGEIFFEFT